MGDQIERVEPVLSVRDVLAALSFYARLGFEEKFRDDDRFPPIEHRRPTRTGEHGSSMFVILTATASSSTEICDRPCQAGGAGSQRPSR